MVFVSFATALWMIDRTRIGTSWLAVRHGERATPALGRSVPCTKLSAFALSVLMAGVAGAMFAGQLGIVTRITFAQLTSLTAFAVAVMVSARYVEGRFSSESASGWGNAELDARSDTKVRSRRGKRAGRRWPTSHIMIAARA